MRRRGLLSSLIAAWPLLGRPARLKIAGLELFRVEGEFPRTKGVNRQYSVNPLHIYDGHRPKEYRDGQPVEGRARAGAIYMRIKTDEGLEGLYGPIDREAAVVVDQQLKGFITGKDALAGETLWDQMHRSNRHSRRGHFMLAISAVDNALWDLRGRYFEAPVYRLLGGPTRADVEAYGSCLGYSVEPEKVRERSQAVKADGYRHQKWFMAHGPGDGAEGLERNVSLVRNLRDSLGESVEIMFDAFSGWQLDYAIAWAKQVERFRPRWIEEAFPADRIEAFAQLRRATSVPVASGEHFYGRWEVHDYLRAGAISVIQADPEWCGGVSELVKICSLASLFDAQVIPHGHSVHAALHVVASQSPATCPLVEYLILKMATYYEFEKLPPHPVKGRIPLSDRPGFGIELDPSKFDRQIPLRWS